MRKKILKYDKEDIQSLTDLIHAAELSDISEEKEVAGLLGISPTALQRSKKTDYRFKDIFDNTKQEIKIRFMKALMKMAEGYYVEEEKGEIKYSNEGNTPLKRATRYEKKWVPGDEKIARKIMEIMNPTSKFADKPTTVKNTILNITVNNAPADKKRKEIKPDYTVEG